MSPAARVTSRRIASTSLFTSASGGSSRAATDA